MADCFGTSMLQALCDRIFVRIEPLAYVQLFVSPQKVPAWCFARELHASA
jgi:hypothetical protein